MAKREILISDSEHAPSGVPTNNSVDYSSLGNVTPPNIRFSDTYSFRIDRFVKISKKKHLTFVLTELSAELSPNSIRFCEARTSFNYVGASFTEKIY